MQCSLNIECFRSFFLLYAFKIYLTGIKNDPIIQQTNILINLNKYQVTLMMSLRISRELIDSVALHCLQYYAALIIFPIYAISTLFQKLWDQHALILLTKNFLTNIIVPSFLTATTRTLCLETIWWNVLIHNSLIQRCENVLITKTWYVVLGLSQHLLVSIVFYDCFISLVFKQCFYFI